MSQLVARPSSRLILALLAILSLTACTDLAAALPPRPTAAPTLARLPSVTPVTPSATLSPTTTPTIVIAPTPVPLFGAVVVAANVRAGPGLDFAIMAGLDAGVRVLLLSRSADWYEIEGPDGVTGWMSAQVLEVDVATAAAVPLRVP